MPLPHDPALDGLRGAAVVAVVAFHLGWIDGGWLGVDAFFVLSGYLIGTLLLDEATRDGRIRLGAFWIRRARRLLPALTALLLVVAAWTAWGAAPVEQADLRDQLLATLGYVANWQSIAAGNDYWTQFQAPSPLAHTWSLAIEEQIYIVLPLAVLGLAAVSRRFGQHHRFRNVVGGCALLVGAVSALAMRALHTASSGPDRVYLGTDTRLTAAMVGVALAAWLPHLRSPSAAKVFSRLAPVVAVGLAGAWWVVDGNDARVYEGGLALHGVAVGVVLAGVVVSTGTRLRAVLSWRPLTVLGLVSYGLYLWHWPLIVWLTPARVGVDGLALDAVVLVATAGATAVSYRFVEAPWRGIRRRTWSDRTVVVAAPAVAIACAIAFLALPATRPGPPPIEVASFAAVAPEPPASPTPSDVSAAAPTRLVVLGDSGAAFLGAALAQVAPADLDVRVDGTIGCGILTDGGGVVLDDGRRIDDAPGCEGWAERWAESAAGADTALVVLAWPGMGSRSIDGGPPSGPCDPVFDEAVVEAARTAVHALTHDTGVRTVRWATPSPFRPPGSDAAEGARRTVDCLTDAYRSAVGAHALIDLDGWTCPDGVCRTDASDGSLLRPDGLHYEGQGAVDAATWLLARLGAAPGAER